MFRVYHLPSKNTHGCRRGQSKQERGGKRRGHGLLGGPTPHGWRALNGRGHWPGRRLGGGGAGGASSRGGAGASGAGASGGTGAGTMIGVLGLNAGGTRRGHPRGGAGTGDGCAGGSGARMRLSVARLPLNSKRPLNSPKSLRYQQLLARLLARKLPRLLALQFLHQPRASSLGIARPGIARPRQLLARLLAPQLARSCETILVAATFPSTTRWPRRRRRPTP